MRSAVPSRRDQVEIQAVERRRLAAALVCGDASGDDAPSRARAVLVGAVLALLLVGGAAVAGVLA